MQPGYPHLSPYINCCERTSVVRTSCKEVSALQTDRPTSGCGTNCGSLPGSCAALVFPYIAYQEKNPARYNRAEALQTGTLFPGLNLPFKADLHRATRDNVIDAYINHNEEDVCAEGIWQNYFTVQPEYLTDEDKREYLANCTGVALGSDAFIPFPDNVQRAYASGVKYIAQTGGSVRDNLVIEECNKYGIAMAMIGVRLFHH